MKHLAFFLSFLFCWQSPSNAEKDAYIPVVFCGFGRTGTHSLAAALERLGYKALHGEELSIHSLDTHQAMGQAVMDHNVPDLVRITAEMGYNATLEVHGIFWREIRDLQKGTDAKYIFTIRDFDSWYESMVATYQTLAVMAQFPVNLIPLHQRIVDVLASAIAHELQLPSKEKVIQLFQSPNSEHHRLLRRRAYDKYVQEMRSITESDPEHALLLDMRQGYGPLCEFLEIPLDHCPVHETFPHLSDRGVIRRNFYMLQTFRLVLYLLPMLAVFLLRFLVQTLFSKATSNNANKEKKKKS